MKKKRPTVRKKKAARIKLNPAKKLAQPKTPKQTAKRLVIANWKMNPDTIKDAKKIFGDFKKLNFDSKRITTVICPPHMYLNELSLGYRGSALSFGAQNGHWSESGASVGMTNTHTGENSFEMIKNTRARYVIVGHAERRALGENNMMVAKKTAEVLKSGLTPIVCVGELERDSQGEYLRFLEAEIRESLSRVEKNKLSKIVLVYEPVWAIGAGNVAMSSHELYQMIIFIKKVLVSMYGRKLAMSANILYGGSVDDENCTDILSVEGVGGLLVGRASLNPEVFGKILKNI